MGEKRGKVALLIEGNTVYGRSGQEANPDITTTSDPLLRDLLDRGLARPDPLRLGLDASPGGAVLDASGRPSRTTFTLGPLLRGLRYETTAIPEIRDQAATAARSSPSLDSQSPR